MVASQLVESAAFTSSRLYKSPREIPKRGTENDRQIDKQRKREREENKKIC